MESKLNPTSRQRSPDFYGSGDDSWKPVVVTPFDTLPRTSDQVGSYDGAGTLEMLEVVKILEGAGITCCMVGIGALKYFGAWRVLHHWEVCVPTSKFEIATKMFTLPPYAEQYERRPPEEINVWSLHHTFPLLKLRGNSTTFYLIPSDDCHIECIPLNIEHSKMRLPYPKLDVFAQALLDTVDQVAITDLVDGMDLDNEWAASHLNLDKTHDVVWAAEKNVKLKASAPGRELFEISTEPAPIRPLWEEAVKNKEQRIGLELSKEYFVTRFRPVGQGDPRLKERDFV